MDSTGAAPDSNMDSGNNRMTTYIAVIHTIYIQQHIYIYIYIYYMHTPRSTAVPSSVFRLPVFPQHGPFRPFSVFRFGRLPFCRFAVVALRLFYYLLCFPLSVLPFYLRKDDLTYDHAVPDGCRGVQPISVLRFLLPEGLTQA